MVHNTVSGNSATYIGGGIMNTGTLYSTYNTFAFNLAPSGSNLVNFMEVYMTGTILDGVSGENCMAAIPSAAINDMGFNLSSDASCAFTGPGSVNNANLLLGQLSGGVHTPSAGSDAIGAIPYGTIITGNGLSLTCNGSMTDQLGSNRPINADDACTSGSVEVAPSGPVSISAKIPVLTAPADGLWLASTPLLTWTPVNGASQYILQFDHQADFRGAELVEITVPDTKFTPPTLPSGTTYWRVRALFADGSLSEWSAIRRFSVR